MITIHKSLKMSLVVIGSIVVIAAIAVFSVVALKTVLPTKQSPTSSTPELNAQASLDKALKAENSGDTEKALAEYKAALVEYKKTNNTNKIADMEAKIRFAEKTLVQEKALNKQSVPVDDAPPTSEPERELDKN